MTSRQSQLSTTDARQKKAHSTQCLVTSNTQCVRICVQRESESVQFAFRCSSLTIREGYSLPKKYKKTHVDMCALLIYRKFQLYTTYN